MLINFSPNIKKCFLNIFRHFLNNCMFLCLLGRGMTNPQMKRRIFCLILTQSLRYHNLSQSLGDCYQANQMLTTREAMHVCLRHPSLIGFSRKVGGGGGTPASTRRLTSVGLIMY